LYPVATAYLRRPAAEAIRDIQLELQAQGLGLKIYDGYRPYSVTEMMWEPIRNSDFVADPAKGSRHNRGAAVDLTLVDANGRELAMPTPYDDFTSHARHDFNDLPPDALANRARLKDVMTRHGFELLPSEWWHYDFSGWQQFELLNVPLEKLEARHD
jgi:zinc D-Ala-D-Ala dipeptidase